MRNNDENLISFTYCFKAMIHWFSTHENNYLDRQRLIITGWYTLILTIGLVVNMTGISGPVGSFYIYNNGTLLVLIALWGIFYLNGRWSITTTVQLMTITTQLFITFNTLHGALLNTAPHPHVLILVNTIILMGNITFSLATYQTITSLINISIAALAYLSCTLVTNDETLMKYMAIVMLTLLYTGILGLRIARNAQRLQEENTMMRHDEEELLHILRLNKQQVKSYIRLSKNEYSDAQTRLLLSQFGESAQKHIISNVTRFIRAEATVDQHIEQAFPELTPSERRIAQLILRGHKLGDICSLLNKSESNINTQRANIRKKMGLQPAENLKIALEKRMEQQEV